MASWSDVEQAVPDLAKAVRAVFDAHKHKVLATLRSDGSPRVSGNEVTFLDDDIWLGMMRRSVKALDLLRDSRLAIHSATADPEMRLGDAKLSGRAVEVTDPEAIERYSASSADQQAAGEQGETGEQAAAGEQAAEPFHLFRVDVGAVSIVRIGDPPDHLVIEFWSPETGYRRTERR